MFFDKVQVVHTRDHILEETHYYPFGLTMAGISSRAASFGGAENKKKYNGIEHTTDLDLNQYNAFYRTLDPQIGRFWQIDPQAVNLESYSPYESMGNNPISNADPLGDFRTWFGAAWHSLWHGGEIGQNKYGEWYVSKNSASSSEDGGVAVKAQVTYGKGRDASKAQRERIVAEIEREDRQEQLVQLGVYERVSVEEAKVNTIVTSVGLLSPTSFIKPATIAVNAPKIQQIEKVLEKIKIQFGKDANQVHHAFRHVDEMGLSRASVQSAIEEHLPTVVSQIVKGKPLNRVIEVAGQRIQYTAFKLPDGTINVGRIHAAN